MSRILIGKALGLNDILDLFYPVGGDPYIQYPGCPTPAERFSNTTWEIDTDMQGRTIIGSGGKYTLGTTGGEEKHTLTIPEMPAHTHNLQYSGEGGGWASIKTGTSTIITETSMGITSTGESRAHNIMQPYIVVNYWKRIA